MTEEFDCGCACDHCRDHDHDHCRKIAYDWCGDDNLLRPWLTETP